MANFVVMSTEYNVNVVSTSSTDVDVIRYVIPVTGVMMTFSNYTVILIVGRQS